VSGRRQVHGRGRTRATGGGLVRPRMRDGRMRKAGIFLRISILMQDFRSINIKLKMPRPNQHSPMSCIDFN